MINAIINDINDAWYHQCGCVNPNIVAFCYDYGYYSWDDTIDENGNLLDSFKIITQRDFQDACDALGIIFDAINY